MFLALITVLIVILPTDGSPMPEDTRHELTLLAEFLQQLGSYSFTAEISLTRWLFTGCTEQTCGVKQGDGCPEPAMGVTCTESKTAIETM